MTICILIDVEIMSKSMPIPHPEIMKASHLRQLECIFEHEREQTIKCHQKPPFSRFVAPESLAIAKYYSVQRLMKVQ